MFQSSSALEVCLKIFKHKTGEVVDPMVLLKFCLFGACKGAKRMWGGGEIHEEGGTPGDSHGRSEVKAQV